MSTHEGPVVVAVLWMRQHDTRETNGTLQTPVHTSGFLIFTPLAITPLFQKPATKPITVAHAYNLSPQWDWEGELVVQGHLHLPSHFETRLV